MDYGQFAAIEFRRFSSLTCKKNVMDPKPNEKFSSSPDVTGTIEAFRINNYENPLWFKVIGIIKGVLFVLAIVYSLCFTITTLLITFLEIEVETIFAIELMFRFGFWLLGASIWILIVGLILRRKTVGMFWEISVRGCLSLGVICNV